MGSHKDTLLLPQTTFPIKADLPVKESARFASWGNVYDRMKRDGKDPFILHDGPPYANGDIHIGHALNKILKDFVVKTQFFNGRAVEFVPGWDCHGLPIESKVYSIIRVGGGHNTPKETVIRMCRKYAAKQIEIQKGQFKALGILADWDNHYETMSPAFEAMIGNRLTDLKRGGYLSHRRKPVYWSWSYGTALAEAEVEHRERTDKSAYVVFKTDKFPWGLLVWTTTPWTLPANVAVALNPTLQYVAVHVKNYDLPVLVAADTVKTLTEKGIVIDTVKNYTAEGAEFEGWKFQHPVYPEQTVPCVMAEFVTPDAGTGCVHIAPGHGEEDYLVGLRYGLPVVMPVGPSGSYTEGKYGPSEENKDGLWIFEDDSNDSLAAARDGTYKKCTFQTNEIIFKDLKAAGVLVATEDVVHNYPYCVRSGTPVIFRATEQWFFDLDKVRNVVFDAVAGVEFYPESSKNRMMPMLKSRPDWCISRQRTWGVPIFDSEHILDVWFDSGLTWNTLNGRQADVYFEGNDQHRGWFQSSLWLSAALTGKAPYKKVVTHGFVLDPKGRKMSKREGNVVNPNDVIAKYGAEVLRYWAASIDYTKDVSVGDDILARAAEGHKKLRNTFRFMLSNLTVKPFPLEGEFLPVDHWIQETAAKVFAEVHASFEKYEYYKGLHRLTEFVNAELNAIYFNAIKDRLYCDKADSYSRNSAVLALTFLLDGMLALVAPVFTYTADEVLSHAPDWFKTGRRDIFDYVYVNYPPPPRCEFLAYIDAEYWKAVLEAFHGEFDKLKTAGAVKDTLEVTLESFQKHPPKQPFFAKAEDWFVVSGVSAIHSDVPSLATFVVQGDTYRIVKSAQNKCERCWKRSADHDLCARCQNVLI